MSKHLQILHAARFVERRKEGLHVFYALAGSDVFRLCDLMCDRLAAEAVVGVLAPDGEERRRAWGRATHLVSLTAGAFLATLVNPYGLTLYPWLFGLLFVARAARRRSARDKTSSGRGGGSPV